MNKQSDISLATLHAPTRHDSGPKHVTGTAEYIDDMIEPLGTMHAYLGLSTRPHAEIAGINLEAVRSAPGVIGVLAAEDIPGENDVSPSHKHDEPIFAVDEVQFWGQPLFAVIGETRDAARRAAQLARIDYHDKPWIPDVRAAQEDGGKLVTEPLKLERGEVDGGLAAASRRVKGSIAIGGQDHFYLEGQIALAVPGEDEDVTVHSSTQHPSEVQLMVAQVLGIRHSAVTVNVRRIGGGFAISVK